MVKFLNATRKFISGTIEELHKCTWPSREELYESTVVVIAAVIILSIFVATVDLVSVKIIRLLTSGF